MAPGLSPIYMNSDWRAWEDDIEIQSSENVNFSLETAGVGSRLGAAFADYLIQGATILLIFVAAVWARSTFPDGAEWVKWVDSIGDALLIFLVSSVMLSYHFLFEWLWDGQTPGKRWNGLRVLQSDGMPAGLWPIAVRNLLRTIDFLPFGYALGGATALFSSHNRRIGDMVAGTIVARERHEAGQRVLAINEAVDAFLSSFNTTQTTSAQATTSVAVPTPASNISAPPTVFAPRLSDEEHELLTSFLQRRDKLRPEPRARLAHSLATRLSNRLQMPLPARDESEAFLMTLLLALHQQEQTPRA